MRPVAVLKRVDPDEAVVQPGGLDLGRQVQFTVALVHRQEPVHSDRTCSGGQYSWTSPSGRFGLFGRIL